MSRQCCFVVVVSLCFTTKSSASSVVMVDGAHPVDHAHHCVRTEPARKPAMWAGQQQCRYPFTAPAVAGFPAEATIKDASLFARGTSRRELLSAGSEDDSWSFDADGQTDYSSSDIVESEQPAELVADFARLHEIEPQSGADGCGMESPMHVFGNLPKAMAGIAAVIALATPLVRALSSHWPYFVAGGICAAVSHTAAVPLDVVKTRMQCSRPGEYAGPWRAFVKIYDVEGAGVLFSGAGATLVGYAIQGFLKFGFFEFLKPVFLGLFNGGAVKGAGAVLGSLLAASVAAEIMGSSALTPLEAARIRMVADKEYAPGLRSALVRMLSEEGIGVLTRGLPAVLAKQLPYTATKLVTFDAFMRAANNRGGGRAPRLVTLACAVSAGVLSSLASQPGDSLLSLLNAERRGASAARQDRRGETVAQAMFRLTSEVGCQGLFRGTATRLLHVTTIVTLQLLVYQAVKRVVGINQ